MSHKDDDKHRKHADALEALARGREAEASEPAEADSSLGPSSGLMLLSEDDENARHAEDLLQDLPGGAEDEVNPSLDELAAASGGAAGDSVVELGDVAAASVGAATPGFQAQRATRLQANVRRSHAHAYRKTMIPLLLAVGLLLFAFSALTAVMLLGDEAGNVADGMTYLQAYGKYFIVAALPLGAILLMGAWLFYLDVKKSESSARK